jgi:hypothetical protein
MPDNKFKVGEMVDFFPSKRGVPASARSYKVLRLIPYEGESAFIGSRRLSRRSSA